MSPQDHGEPVYFGPHDRRLYGWLYQPADLMAGVGVVMCGPLGMEEFGAQPALMRLGAECAARGMTAIKFHYDGTGNSMGGWDDPDRLSAWIASVGEAVKLMRDSGVRKVVVVGVHLGALFAAKSALSADADGIVFWAPTLSGRMFLRQQQMLLATITGRDDSKGEGGTFEGPLFEFNADVATALREASVTKEDVPGGIPTLTVAETEDAPPALRRAGWPTDIVKAESVASGMGEYPNPYSEPAEDVESILAWVEAHFPVERSPLDFKTEESLQYVTASGQAVCERPVWIGDVPLSGILTEPAGSEHHPVAVFLSTGIWTNVGTGHMWSRLARQWADLGVRSLRIDLSGLGESPSRPGRERREMFPKEVVDDFGDIARYFGTEDGSNLVFVGMSSGAFHCVEAGLTLRPRAIVIANPTPGQMLDLLSSDVGSPVGSRAYRHFPGPLKRLSVRHRRVAVWAWKWAAQVVVSWAPGDPIAKVIQRGVPVWLFLGEEDRRHLAGNGYWTMMFKRYVRQGRLVMTYVPGVDHGFFTSWQRRSLFSALSGWMPSVIPESSTLTSKAEVGVH
jgi:dienelactone hydrolase